ncbi:phosphoadenylyl-sulfate reductase [Akkermansiaceae bacterium]|nr:phosphoadenylyl-sulfate reductase [Akkermansiaceae bacterium]
MATIISEAEEIAGTLEAQQAGERIAWLYETFGDRVVASSSFGLQAAVMLNLIAKNAPQIPIIFVDTGYLFSETYAYIEELKSQLDVDIRHYVPRQTAAHQEAIYGKLWEQGAEGNQKYATINKVEPMNRAIQEIGGDIWLSGLRRSQSSTRANRQLAEQQSSTLKVYPILDWADAQVASYFYENNLPKHPLEEKGYVTMGDWHSTRLPKQGEDAESTRYNGEKYECGLHEASGENDFQI